MSSEVVQPNNLTTVSDIISSLSAIQVEEAQISDSLSELLSSKETLVGSLDRLQTMAQSMRNLRYDISLVSGKVSTTAQTASRVGNRVQLLDEEMSRVKQSLELVGSVMELKSSLQLLRSSIHAEDYDAATRHCARAMAIPSQVVGGEFAEMVIPSVESTLSPADALESARTELLAIFTDRFLRASSARDVLQASRFFKLYPVIGWEAEGLAVYAKFVIDLIRNRPISSVKVTSPAYYITVMTTLFEHVAHLIDQHQPLVEKYYGVGKMATVVGTVLEECKIIVKRYLEAWEEERSIKRLLTTINTPSFNSNQSARKPNMSIESELVDPRDVDKLLSEISGMAGRWALFQSFLQDRLSEEDAGDPQQIDTAQQLSISSNVKHMLNSSGCQQLFDMWLSTCYLPLEVWYLKTIIEKAFKLSTIDQSSKPPISTIPDDVFYVLKIVMRRLFSTGSMMSWTEGLPIIREVVAKSYTSSLKTKMDDVYGIHDSFK